MPKRIIYSVLLACAAFLVFVGGLEYVRAQTNIYDYRHDKSLSQQQKNDMFIGELMRGAGEILGAGSRAIGEGINQIGQENKTPKFHDDLPSFERVGVQLPLDQSRLVPSFNPAILPPLTQGSVSLQTQAGGAGKFCVGSSCNPDLSQFTEKGDSGARFCTSSGCLTGWAPFQTTDQATTILCLSGKGCISGWVNSASAPVASVPAIDSGSGSPITSVVLTDPNPIFTNPCDLTACNVGSMTNVGINNFHGVDVGYFPAGM